MQQESDTLNLQQALSVLRRRLPLILLCAVVVAGAAYVYSKQLSKQYTATASLAFSYSSLSQQIAGLPASSNGNLLAQQASNLELVKLGDMAAETASQLGHGLTAEKVDNSLSISGEGESSIVRVSATSAVPAVAAVIANTYTKQFVMEQKIANRHYFKSALALVNKQLAALSPKQRVTADGLQLQNRAQTLGLLAELNYGDVQIAQEALTPTSPSSPKTSRNTALGLVLGLLIGLSLAFVLERLDQRIRSPEDLEAIYGLPMLGVIPNSPALSRPSRRDGRRAAGLPPQETEAFRLIRAHLRFFNVDRKITTIAVASAAAGDGKTTVALHLAEAEARLGSRVLLIELDLRDPTVSHQLGIEPRDGVADVLIGHSVLSAAVQEVNLDEPTGVDNEGAASRTLDVLVAGTLLPPNPAQLLESRAMDALLQHAKSTYDLVVIDTPPLTAVSDAFTLLNKVDGVVIVGWVGRSRRDTAEQLHQVLATSGTRLLGVIANGSNSGTPSIYGPTRTAAPPSISSGNGSGPSEHVPTARV